MKHMIGRLTAVSAAAITAFSMVTAAGMTAEALTVTSSTNFSSLDIDKNLWGKDTDSPEEDTFLNYLKKIPSSSARSSVKGSFCRTLSNSWYEKLLPEFDKTQTLPSKIDITVEPKLPTAFGQNTTYFCTFDNATANLSTIENNSARKLMDKITVKTKQKSGSIDNYGLLIEYYNPCYSEGNHFAGRLYSDDLMKTRYLDKMYLAGFNLDEETGHYIGAFVIPDYYVAGLRLSSTDDCTHFYEPMIRKDPYGDGIRTEIHFYGDLNFATDGRLYFSGGKTYNLLRNLKITYNGCQTPIVKNNWVRIYEKNANGTYTGMLTDNTLKKIIDADDTSNLNNFKDSNFFGIIESGKTLYICVGKNVVKGTHWKNSYGDNKLNVLLNENGYKTAFQHNTWLVNWLRTHNSTDYTIKFTENATPSSKGSMFYDCSAVTFKNKLGV